MKIQNNYTQTNFGQLYIASIEAEKLLKKADRVIKANPNVTYINTNIPAGHSKTTLVSFFKSYSGTPGQKLKQYNH